MPANPDCTTMAVHGPHVLIHDGPCEGRTHEEAGEFDVAAWWRRTDSDDFDKFVPKFDEYGSEDLLDIGRNMAAILHREVSDEEANELGMYFYLYGKMARWTEAVKTGRRPSDDTLEDVVIYAKMARLNRAGGMN